MRATSYVFDTEGDHVINPIMLSEELRYLVQMFLSLGYKVGLMYLIGRRDRQTSSDQQN